MTEKSPHSQGPRAEIENPEIYSIHHDEEGKIHFSRKDFLYLGAAVGGTLLVRGVCPRFGTRSSPNEPAQAGMLPLAQVSVHTEPSIASNIADTLQNNDMVRLINDHPELGWTEVATRRIQRGWVKRSYIDFSRAVRSSSPDFDLNSSMAQSPTAVPTKSFSVQLHGGTDPPNQVSAPDQIHACGEIIQNGNFESGSVIWVEDTTGAIITDQWTPPYQGSWVAWMGGLSATERLTQRFHVPAYAQDAQKLEFYLMVNSADPNIQRNDVFYLRFLNGAGSPVSTNIFIADNTDKGAAWNYIYVDITGIQSFADQDLQVQFVAVVDSAYISSFVIDAVSLNMVCDPTPTPKPVFYVYLPITIKPVAPTPTRTTTPTPTRTATSCASHCSFHCPSDCGYDCGSDCTYDCSSDCTFDCIYDCTFDCIYDCSFDW